MKNKPLVVGVGLLWGITALFGAHLLFLHLPTSSDVIIDIGTVQYIHLEGGFYGIITDNGTPYLPLNLPPPYKIDGLRIWFKAKPKPVFTYYMWGRPIEITGITRIITVRTVTLPLAALEVGISLAAGILLVLYLNPWKRNHNL
ncbi:MAG: hypothetical protein GWO20_03335 [Candidatus Korarchaeota archaeon]|nr:hypothetical protein [Candidatus Korarchaeota archaeon]NIU81907.1 hypothetical protein [Candidatus Thorarchaeota archaeon]NIW12365.1 hypothetical protein [Candidatus Thorarchaeota archaeon]NIW51157.1 hypothetical protein [Candidatus Korarchaeota archaeon]